MKAVILYGDVPKDAPEDEQDTLVEVESVSGALLGLGHQPVPLPLTLDLRKAAETLTDIRPAFVFNLVESLEGKGRLIHMAPALLDYLGIPYTGSPTEAMFTTSNKLLSKRHLRASGIPTLPWLSPGGPPDGAFGAPGRYIIKSHWEHASIGLSEESVVYAENPGQLLSGMEQRGGKSGGELYAEQYIDGREYNLSVLEVDGRPKVMPPAEILFVDYPPDKLRIVDYKAKWVEGSFEYENTPRTFDFKEEDRPLLDELTDIAVRCWRAFGVRGYARVDFRVDPSGRPWVLEINANPCITPYGGFIAACAQGGFGYNETVEKIVGCLRLG